MATLSQATRPMRLTTMLAADELLIDTVSGVEGLSMPFQYTIGMLSENPAIAPEPLLWSPVTVTFDVTGGGERYINGLIRRFAQAGKKEGLAAYTAEVVPTLWFLSLISDCRIFQNLSVPDIVKQVLKGVEASFQLHGTYKPREYCVQYHESDLDFVSRLLEEEGIYYYFEHTAGGHTLVLADNPTAVKYGPGPQEVQIAITDGDVPPANTVTDLRRELAVHTGKVTLRDYDYLKPTTDLEASVHGKEKPEAYAYPGKYTLKEEGERYARLQVEAHEALRTVVHGESNCLGFQSGKKIDLAGHYESSVNGTYQLLRVQIEARVGDYRTEGDSDFEYRNAFTAIPAKVPFRPQRVTARPIIYGSQTAVVVGPKGEEIYTETHGRVKVQFFWDRLGKKNENSSCWVRVSSGWAGKAWGAVHLPRIGQEVIVDFLEGDPDRPIITGRVYNAAMTPPYALPANQTQSGVKSRSSKGGSSDNFNEIRFEDKKGHEELLIHAEKDKRVVVEHDRTESVGHDESISIGNNRKENVGGNESISIAKNRSESVGGNESISIDKSRSEQVTESETVGVGKNRSHSVGQDDSLDVTANRTVSVGKNEQISVGENRSTNVGKNDELTVGKKLVIDAADEIMIKTGDAAITMKKNGDITIKGNNITVDGSGKITVKASSDVNIKGSKVTAN